MKKTRFSLLVLLVLFVSMGTAQAIGRLYGRIPNWVNSPVFNLRIKSFDVTVTIQDQLAITHIDEIFANDNFQRLEGIYILKLPEGAKLTEMYLWIGNERLKQEIKPREEAVQTFEEIVRRQTDPLLAEEIGDNTFRFRLFPIDPNSERRIEIKYIHLLPYDSGQVTYLFPLDVSDFETDPIERGSLQINLKSQFPIDSLATPSYPDPPANTITQVTPTEYKIEFGNENFIPDKDYDLFFSVERDKVFYALSYLPPDSLIDDNFFLLWVAPPDSIFVETEGVKNIVFVADVSSSMEGEHLQALKTTLKFFLETLTPADRFNIIAFSTSVVKFRTDLLQATADNIREAEFFISRLAALGLSNLNAALDEALQQSFDSESKNTIVLITDGKPNHGVSDPATILSNVRNNNSQGATISAIGFGGEIDRRFLRVLTIENNGLLFHEESLENLTLRLPNIYRRMTLPTLDQISLDYEPQLTFDRFPVQPTNLAVGSQIVEAGRFFMDNSFSITMSGEIEGQAISVSEQVTFPGDSTNLFVSRIWAGKKIDFLLKQIDLFGEIDELVSAVVNLSIKYSVLSPYTAFLIIEPGQGVLTDVEEPDGAVVPASFTLFQNYPNPFNPETTIRYHIAPSDDCSSCLVTLKIYNLLGELVKVLVNENQQPGEYSIIWDSRDEQGRLVPSGVYVYTLEVADTVLSRKMIVLK